MNLGLSTRHIPGRIGVGVFFIAFSLVSAFLILVGARDSASPILYVCIFGGLFSAVPGILGVGIIADQLRHRSKSN